MNMVK